MDALIHKATRLAGKVTAPGSKSYTHRAVAAASLYGDDTLIRNPSFSDANMALIDACTQLGASITRDGRNLRVSRAGGVPDTESPINLGNSGTALRIAISLASLARGRLIITGDDSLQNRPTKHLLDALRTLGVDLTGVPRMSNGRIEEFAPVVINATGRVKGGLAEISCKESSQYLTSLLLIGSSAQDGVEIKVTDMLVSKPYVRMTLDVLRNFGLDIHASDDLMTYRIRPQQARRRSGTHDIPGDYSQAAFPLAAACLVDSDVRIAGLDPDDEQGDKIVVDTLRRMGAVIDSDESGLAVRGPFDLRGVEVDLIDAPDLFPVLSVLGVYAKGSTRLYNMPQIRSKETDRIAVMERELTKYGVRVESEHDEMTVYRTDLPQRDYVFSAKGDQGVTDHRIAMALSLVGIRSGCALIREAHKIAISYPDYLDDMASIGVDIDRTDSQAPPGGT